MKPRAGALFAALCTASAVSLLTLVFVPRARSGWLVAGHLAVSLTVVYSCVRANCCWFGPVVRRFRTSRREVWLTLDDGVCPDSASRVLEVLERFGAVATFFAVGVRVAANPETARRIVRAGHGLENHSRTHPAAFFWACLPPWIGRQMEGGVEPIRRATGVTPRCFRAPVGMANYFAHREAAQQRIRLIGWSARGYDTCTNDAMAIVERIWRDVTPGAIILLHEHRCVSCVDARGVSVLELLLTRLKSEGYRCVIPGPEDFMD
jgi:peptidoglycan/xylan/chitin deacetylase (PgdA/CDA1 family)